MLTALPCLALSREGLGTALCASTAMWLFILFVTAVGAWNALTVNDLVLDAGGLRARTGLSLRANWVEVPLTGLVVRSDHYFSGKGATVVWVTLVSGDVDVRLQLPGGLYLPERAKALAERDWLVRVLTEAARHPDAVERVLRAFSPKPRP